MAPMASVDDCSASPEKNGKAVLADSVKIEKDACLEDSQSPLPPAKVDGPTFDSPTYWELQDMEMEQELQELQQKEHEEMEMKKRAETEFQEDQAIKKRRMSSEEPKADLKNMGTQ